MTAKRLTADPESTRQMLFLRFQREMFKSLSAMLNDEGSRNSCVQFASQLLTRMCHLCCSVFRASAAPLSAHISIASAHEERRENVSRLISRASVRGDASVLRALISSRHGKRLIKVAIVKEQSACFL